MCGKGDSSEQGQGMVEYALLIALVAIVVGGILVLLGPGIGDVFSDVTHRMRDAASGGPTPLPTPEPGATAIPDLPRVVVDPGCSCFDCKVDPRGGTAAVAVGDECICFTSKDMRTVDVTSWHVMDAVKHRYVFPEFRLVPGASVKVHTGRGADSATNLYWGRRGVVWNNKGDTVYLYDSAGNLIDEYSYGRVTPPVPTLVPHPTPPPVVPPFP